MYRCGKLGRNGKRQRIKEVYRIDGYHVGAYVEIGNVLHSWHWGEIEWWLVRGRYGSMAIPTRAFVFRGKLARIRRFNFAVGIISSIRVENNRE